MTLKVEKKSKIKIKTADYQNNTKEQTYKNQNMKHK